MRQRCTLALVMLLAGCEAALCLEAPASLVTGSGPVGPGGPSGPGGQTLGALLEWEDRSTCETGFEIERGLTSDVFSPLATTAAGATSYGDMSPIGTDGAFCGRCFYRVRAVKDGARSAWSNVASSSLPPTGP